jgi:hypothetical protein
MFSLLPAWYILFVDPKKSIFCGALIVADEHSELPPIAASQPSPSSPDTKPAGDIGSKDVLKAAFKAFKKRWKLTQLDQESRIGRGPMSSGQKSSIVGIQPPDQFPVAVWEALVEEGKLKRAGRGQYSMP